MPVPSHITSNPSELHAPRGFSQFLRCHWPSETIDVLQLSDGDLLARCLFGDDEDFGFYRLPNVVSYADLDGVVRDTLLPLVHRVRLGFSSDLVAAFWAPDAHAALTEIATAVGRVNDRP